MFIVYSGYSGILNWIENDKPKIKMTLENHLFIEFNSLCKINWGIIEHCTLALYIDGQLNRSF